MRAVLLLALLAAHPLDHAGVAQRQNRQDRTSSRGRASTAVAPLLALLPGGPKASQLATGVLTGSKGEPTSTTRSGSRGCRSSSSSLAVLGDNLPCVESSGLSVEATHTNLVTQSQTLDQWTGSSAGGSAAPVITANAAAAPDGTTTADRIDLGAVSGAGQESFVYSPFVTSSSSPYAEGIWLKGVSGSGAVNLYWYDGTFLPGTLCNYSSSSWSFCQIATTSANASNFFGVRIGVSSYWGHANAAAQSFYAWGAQLEQGAILHSYVPTTSSSATTQKDVVTTAATQLSSASSVTLDVTPLWSAGVSGVHTLFDSRNAGTSNSGLCLYMNGDALTVISASPSSNDGISTSSLSWNAGQKYHLVVKWGGGVLSLSRDGTVLQSATGKVMPSGFSSSLYVGSDYPGSGPFDGWVSNFLIGK